MQFLFLFFALIFTHEACALSYTVKSFVPQKKIDISSKFAQNNFQNNKSQNIKNHTKKNLNAKNIQRNKKNLQNRIAHNKSKNAPQNSVTKNNVIQNSVTKNSGTQHLITQNPIIQNPIIQNESTQNLTTQNLTLQNLATQDPTIQSISPVQKSLQTQTTSTHVNSLQPTKVQTPVEISNKTAISNLLKINDNNQPQRVCSAKSNRINIRVGPGDRYPIAWVYEKKYLPFKIVSSFYDWYKIEDISKEQGWVHKSLVSFKKTALTTKNTILYCSDSTDSKKIAKIEPMCLFFVLGEKGDFIKVKKDEFKGWILKCDLWPEG